MAGIFVEASRVPNSQRIDTASVNMVARPESVTKTTEKRDLGTVADMLRRAGLRG